MRKKSILKQLLILMMTLAAALPVEMEREMGNFKLTGKESGL